MEQPQVHQLINAIQSIFQTGAPPQILEALNRSLTKRVIWQRLRLRWQEDGAPRGLCLNWLVFPPEALHVFVTRFHKRGRQRLLEDAELQQAIAHAYWQTTWAGSAIRVQRGETWPVAFVPVARAGAGSAQAEPPTAFSIGKGRWIFRRDLWKLHQAQQAAKQGRLFWQDGRFMGEAEADVLAYLNQQGFVDRFIGQNAELTGRRGIEKVVPVHGSHLLTRLAAGEAGHFSAESIDSRRLLAATNSGFFLNFPEEYDHLWTAMNDPVGLFVEQGQMVQLPMLCRGALLVDRTGRAKVVRISMRDVALQLPWESDWRYHGRDHGFELNSHEIVGDRIVVYTPAFRATADPALRRTPEGEVLDLVILFGELMEARVGGGTPIPTSGIVISVPRACLPVSAPERLIQALKAPVRFRLLHEPLGLQPVQMAVTAGPMLLQDGQPALAGNFFETGLEDFWPATLEHGKTRVAGMPPTRFPHDVQLTRAPRTLMGILPSGDILLMVVDGRRQEHSVGATLAEAAALLRAAGCRSGLNLDGGGSSVLFLKHAESAIPPLAPEVRPGIVNLPSDAGHQERLIPVPLFIMDNGG